jgi:tyrosine-protein phosphatase SIW14
MSTNRHSSMACRLTLAASLLVSSALVGCAAAPDDSAGDGVISEAASAVQESPITNFGQVTDGIYRGARPGDEGLTYLDSIGVRTDLDLEIGDYIEAMPRTIAREKAAAESLGLTFTPEPMSAFWKVNDDQMNRILGILADPARRPIYVHCKHGRDRTGLVIGLFRVINEGWAPEDAYAEMLDYGFHPELVLLHHYFEEKTGWED